tara:strand:+ start:23 stop:454 length:432 start_codon:yes stop_codon:yes gene_type:complete
MHTIHHLFHINSPIVKVFLALTDVDKLKQWYTTDVKGSSKLNETLSMTFGQATFDVKIIEREESKRLVWECIDSSMPFVGQITSFSLDTNDEKTRVRVSISGFEALDDMYANLNFSWAKYLESLRQFCQNGTSEAFGSKGYRS